MKIIKSILLMSLVTLSLSVFAQDKVVPFSKVPVKIQTYVKQHFPDNEVVKAEMEYSGLKKEYDIVLSNNIKLEFNKKNDIKSIDAKSQLPDTVIPKSISEYVKSNYPNNYVVEWELDRTDQSVKLNNGIEIKFSLQGKYIGIDD